ncbi:MAG: YbjN domain-containing protein [Actinomycetaceae bacterium]|nr:YbjN domain-containing protein [Actinomycetaceae bacterium]
MTQLTVTPLDSQRLHERLQGHGYQVALRGGLLECMWQDLPFELRVMGGDAPFLSITACWQRSLPPSQYSRLIAACNTANLEQFLPKVYPVKDLAGWSLRSEVIVDATCGLSNQQLDDHLSVAISANIETCHHLDRLLS